MRPLPPPVPDRSSSDVDAELADRLDRLSRRQRIGPAASASTATPGGSRSGRRRHPASRARLTALGLSVVSTGGLAVLFASGGAGASGRTQGAAIVNAPSAPAAAVPESSRTITTSPDLQSSTTEQIAPSTSERRQPTTTPATPVIVDGATFRNRYGNVQIEATFGTDGSLTNVTALQSPGGRGTSIEINGIAIPRLNSEALSAQTSQVDTISGATYTSNGYRQSLQSAIDAARGVDATTLQ